MVQAVACATTMQRALHLPPPPLAHIPGQISMASGIGRKKGNVRTKGGGRVLSEYFDNDYDKEEDNDSGKKMKIGNLRTWRRTLRKHKE